MKKQRYHFSYKGSYSQSYGFSSSHVQRWKLDYKVGWVPKNWWYQTVVLEKILESPLESRRPNHSVLKEITPGYSLEGLMPKLKLWPPDAKSQLIGKKKTWFWKDWEQEEKGTTEDDMVGWPHWLNGHEFEQTQGDSEGQGSLAYYNPWGHKEQDTIERLNNNNITLQITGNEAEKNSAIWW